MHPRLLRFESTPNPNALKCTLDAPLTPSATRSFRAPEDAADDPLASALLNVPGIIAVMFCNDFVTLTRAPGADWGPIRAAVKRLLNSESNHRPQGE